LLRPAPDPTEPGRWREVARSCAARAFHECAAVGHGPLSVGGKGVVAFYDNRLPLGSMVARERVVALFRRHLADEGVHVLAVATYPQSGPDDGRSLAMVLDASDSDEGGVTAAWARATNGLPPGG
jgi:hypothetical protein